MVETSRQTDTKRPPVPREDVERKAGAGPSSKADQVADRVAHKAARDEQEYDRVHGEFTK
ncbi:MAG TPA: hypothetical protein VG893_06645 [Terracidiphilus sp.]|nr:hypothetical protein [Terracidiphilus sp.]